MSAPRPFAEMPGGLLSSRQFRSSVRMTDVSVKTDADELALALARGAHKTAGRSSCGRRLGLLLPVALAVVWEMAVRFGWSNGRLVPPP